MYFIFFLITGGIVLLTAYQAFTKFSHATAENLCFILAVVLFFAISGITNPRADLVWEGHLTLKYSFLMVTPIAVSVLFYVMSKKFLKFLFLEKEQQLEKQTEANLNG